MLPPWPPFHLQYRMGFQQSVSAFLDGSSSSKAALSIMNRQEMKVCTGSLLTSYHCVWIYLIFPSELRNMENLHHKAPNLNLFRDAEETPFPINFFQTHMAELALIQANKNVPST